MQDDLLGLEEEETAQGVSRHSPKSVLMPAEKSVLREARLLAGDKNVRIGKLAGTVAQDPIITLELLRTANTAFYSGDRPSIATVQTAVIRLGSQTIVETLDSLGKRPSLDDPEVSREFELLRALARKTSLVSGAIAGVVQRDITEIAQTTGLMSYMGYMIACAYLGEEYLDISHGRKRSAIAYRISQECGFDITSVMLEYLRVNGIPGELFYGLDRELKCKTTSQASLRFIVSSGLEFVEAWDNGKWDKYAPNQTLPSTSALRLLKISDAQYADLYTNVTEILKGKTSAPTNADRSEPNKESEEEFEPPTKTPPAEKSLSPLAAKNSKRIGLTKTDQYGKPSSKSAPTLILTRKGFGGYDPNAQPTNFIESEPEEINKQRESLSEDAKKVLDVISMLCGESKTANELLVRLMNLLISDGPFVRAAIILLTPERESAEIHTAVGEGFEGGDNIAVRDPLSPLALCLTQIKSFNSSTMDDTISPFGITSYAISPLKLEFPVPVVLYADCGLNRPLPLEARKIFRLVVGLINRTLPRLPGGLPSRTVPQVSA